MSGAIVVVIVVVTALVFAVAVLVRRSAQRRHLQRRFGPEYERMVSGADHSRAAERELAERERRHRELDLRPLEPAARERYSAAWASVQERFVDGPEDALAEAAELVTSVMRDRGYPTEEHGQQVADLSVEHAQVVDRYRTAHEISSRTGRGEASTEDMRQALIHYRALFENLLDMSAQHGQPEHDHA